jgi:hypothetical protein
MPPKGDANRMMPVSGIGESPNCPSRVEQQITRLIFRASPSLWYILEDICCVQY